MTFWDKSFSAPGYKYGTEPNAFLTEQAFRLKPGSRVLVPGDGEGRNGVWLAEQGHHVTTVDASQVGVDKARDLARRRGVTIDAIHADFSTWSPSPAAYDAVVLTFVHLPTSKST